jgi:hypothetical protein
MLQPIQNHDVPNSALSINQKPTLSVISPKDFSRKRNSNYESKKLRHSATMFQERTLIS